MSKPINAERKEMARKLRDYAGANVEWIAPWAVFHDWNGDNSALLTNHLADLIDPVCEPVVELEDDCFTLKSVKCSACGEDMPLECRYCPNCGARVVSCND